MANDETGRKDFRGKSTRVFSSLWSTDERCVHCTKASSLSLRRLFPERAQSCEVFYGGAEEPAPADANTRRLSSSCAPPKCLGVVAARGSIESFQIGDGQQRRGQDFPIFVGSKCPCDQRVRDTLECKDIEEIEDRMGVRGLIASQAVRLPDAVDGGTTTVPALPKIDDRK